LESTDEFSLVVTRIKRENPAKKLSGKSTSADNYYLKDARIMRLLSIFTTIMMIMYAKPSA